MVAANAIALVAMTRRECYRKKKHPTRRDAEAACDRMGFGTVAFPCQVCGQFHIGKPTRAALTPEDRRTMKTDNGA